jgi:NTP pyrophosphatase (non-canonical NTP hydrolase)
MSLDLMAQKIHLNATEKGFWDYMYLDVEPKADPFIFYAKQIAMIHSEATEVLEAMRKTKGQDQVVEELADIIIRVLDLYGGLKIQGQVQDSLDLVMDIKMRKNTERPRLHGVLG